MGEPLRPQLPEIFRFRPWPIGDPVPDWVLGVLDKSALRELGVIQLEFHKAILDAGIKTVDRALSVLSKMR